MQKKFATNNIFQEFKDNLSLFMQFFSFTLLKTVRLDRWRDKI